MRNKAGERGIGRYLVEDWQDHVLPVTAFLVEHPAGLCLFDTGQTAKAAAASWFPRWHPFFRLSRFELAPADEVGAQLRSRGIDPTQIGYVVLSHLHTDHAGGLEPFGHAKVVVSRTEWQRANGLRGRLRGYLPQYWPAEIEPALIDFEGPAFGPFTGSHDLMGDGRLVLVPTPGHTAGHLALLVRSAERTSLLAGDVAHNAVDVERVAPAIAAWCRAEGIEILTAHEPAVDAARR